MAYDSADGYIVEFGGTANGEFTGTTWEFSAGVWTQATPTISPGSREGAAMTYDAADGYVLLFGGSNGAATLGDTWEFKAGQWTLLQPATPPSARSGASMAYDAADGYVVLFGGLAGSGTSLGDTWEYRSGSWTPLTPSSHPSPRSWASMAYDSADGYVLLLGGSTTHTESDTWTFLAGVWTNISGTAGSPGARMGAAMTYDGADHYVVLFGGASHGLLSGTWKFTGGTWTSLSAAGPSGRLEAGLAYDSFHQETILFGGIGAGQPQAGDFWTTWNYGAGTWTLFSPAGSPASRDEFAMVWDSADNYVLLFGGINGATYLGDTWSFRAGHWTEIESAQATAGQCTQISNGATVSCPAPRAATSMTWDGFDNYVALFGGFNGGDLGDTWKFSAGAWTELEVVGTGGTCNYVGGGTGVACPSQREWAAFADYYPNTGYAVLFGGTGSSGALADTWEFHWGAWTALSPNAHPSARYGAAVATEFSSGTGYVLLFGGFSSGNTPLSDSWEYEWQAGGPTWVQQSPSTHPSARGYANLADGNPAVLFGGDTGLAATDDTWTYASGQWTQVATTTEPDVRNSLGIVDDTADGFYVLFAGANLARPYGDTWTYGLTLTATTPTVTRTSEELGQAEAFTTGASGGGTGTYSYYWGGLPPGCTPSGTAASLSCTPTAAGSYYVNSVVMDSNGNAPATSSLTAITVYGDPTTTAPTGSPWSIDLNQQVTFRTTTTGGTGTYTWTWSGLPGGCTPANSSSITCTPDVTGASSVKVSVKDTNGFSVTSGTLSFTVIGDPTAATPTTSKFSVDVNQPVTYGETPSGGANSYYHYSWNGLPSGCSSTNASSLPCTPAVPGVYTVGATVTDANGYPANSPALSFVVHSNPSVTLAENLTVLDLGQSLQFTATASGGSGTYSYWYQGLPCATANLSVLNCTPSTTGTFTVTVTVNDTLGGTATSSQVFFGVNLDPSATTWFSRGASVAYANQSLILQVNYSQGTPNYHPCLDAPGSTLGGIRCGAWQGGSFFAFGFWYTQPGTYTIVASVEDSTGWNTTVTLTETIYWPLAKGTATLPAVLDSGMLANGTAQVIHGIPTFSVWYNDTTAGSNVCFVAPSTDGSSLCRFTPGWIGSHNVETTVRDARGMAWYANNSLLVNPALHRLYLNASVGAFSATLGGTLQDEITASTLFSGAFAGGTGPYAQSWGYNGSISMGSGASLTYAWSHASTYMVTYVVQDRLGKTLSGSITVQVNPTASNLVLGTHFSQLDVGTSDNLTLNFSGGLSPFSYSWNFGDGNIKGTSHPWVLHSWASAGPFTVTVTLTDGASIQLQTTVRVTVIADPLVLNLTARFGSSLVGAGGTLDAYPNGTLSFSGLFAGGIGPYQLSWTANGTSIGSQQGSGPWFNATHIWTGMGSYQLKFWVTDVEGHSSSASLTVVLRPDLLTQVILTPIWMALDEGVLENLTVTFLGGLGPFSYAWDLGDGNTPTTGVPWQTHAWAVAGTLVVSVVVHDSLGASATASINVAVTLPLSVPCGPTANATTIWAGDPIALSISCVANGTAPYSYFWSFGDGGTFGGNSPAAPYTFGAAGNYSVRVVINDSGGGSVASRTLHLQVLTVAEVTPVLESTTYVVDSVSANGAWKEVRVTITAVVFPGSSTITSWRMARLAGGLPGAAWRPWGTIEATLNVTSTNSTQLVSLQVLSALGRSSGPYTATLNLSSLFVQGPGGGGNAGPSVAEWFMIAALVALVTLLAIVGFVALRRKGRKPLIAGTGQDGPLTGTSTDAAKTIQESLKATPGLGQAALLKSVAQKTGLEEATVGTQLEILVGQGTVTRSDNGGGEPTYVLTSAQTKESSTAQADSSTPEVSPEGKRYADRASQVRERVKGALPAKGTVPIADLDAAMSDLDPPVEHHELWQVIAELRAEGALISTEVEKDVFTFSRATPVVVVTAPDAPPSATRSFRAGDLT